MEPNKSPTTTTLSPLLTFLALYFTTLFSLDTWSAALSSPYRAPSLTTSFTRPLHAPPAQGSYQAGMHGRGRAGPSSGVIGGGGGQRGGGVTQARDSRPPIRMGGTAGCGACLI